jgi:hypothetical protein
MSTLWAAISQVGVLGNFLTYQHGPGVEGAWLSGMALVCGALATADVACRLVHDGVCATV